MWTMQDAAEAYAAAELGAGELEGYSRSTHSRGVAGGASVDAALPFTVKLVAIAFLP